MRFSGRILIDTHQATVALFEMQKRLVVLLQTPNTLLNLFFILVGILQKEDGVLQTLCNHSLIILKSLM